VFKHGKLLENECKALSILVPFATTYLCESGFSSLLYLKNKYRNHLNVLCNVFTPTCKALDQGFPNWGTCIPRGTFAYLKGRLSIPEGKNMFIHYSSEDIYTYCMNLSEQFHVTNGVRQRGVLSPYLCAAYLDQMIYLLN